MKLNWDKVTLWENIERSVCSVVSLRKDFANVIYKMGSGLAAHALAIKMYNGDGSEEYTDDDLKIIDSVSKMCQPSVIDAVGEMIAEAKRERTVAE